MKGHYETCDPIAVAVAMHPEIVEESIDRRCFVETKGLLTRGSIIVDWFEKYPTGGTDRKPVKIITKVNSEMMIELLTKSVLE
jgi:inosine-uridine nucleoside N-ribohydrolase